MTSVPTVERGSRAAIYNRVSTTRQAERGLSLDAQAQVCRAEADRRGWTVVAEYVDRGVSGAKDSRPDLDQMRAAAARGEFDYLIIPKLDRLGRSARFLFNVHEELREAHVELVCLSPNIDATTPHGRAQLGMLAVFAEFEREMISERAADTHAERRARGLHNGRPSYGYRRKEAGRWEEDPAEAEVVRRVFREWIDGVSQYAITQRLNADGIKPRNAKEWVQGTIAQMLRRKVYAGLDPDGERPCPCGHPALIEPDVFAKAQSLLGGRHRKGGPNRRTASGHLFLNGYLRCGLCGSPLGPRTDKRHGYEVYKCQRVRNHGAGACSSPVYQRDFLERGIVERFTSRHVDVRAMIAEHERNVGARIAEVRARRDEAQREAIRAADRLARVRRDYQDGKLDAEDWQEMRSELTEEQRAAEGQASQLEAQERELSGVLDCRDSEQEVLQVLSAIQDAYLSPVRDAETLDALRAGFRGIWPNGFMVYPPGSEEAKAFGGGGLVLVPLGEDGKWMSPTDVRLPVPLPANTYSASFRT